MGYGMIAPYYAMSNWQKRQLTRIIRDTHTGMLGARTGSYWLGRWPWQNPVRLDIKMILDMYVEVSVVYVQRETALQLVRHGRRSVKDRVIETFMFRVRMAGANLVYC
jgi:hypothetical protein